MDPTVSLTFQFGGWVAAAGFLSSALFIGGVIVQATRWACGNVKRNLLEVVERKAAETATEVALAVLESRRLNDQGAQLARADAD